MSGYDTLESPIPSWCQVSSLEVHASLYVNQFEPHSEEGDKKSFKCPTRDIR